MIDDDTRELGEYLGRELFGCDPQWARDEERWYCYCARGEHRDRLSIHGALPNYPVDGSAMLLVIEAMRLRGYRATLWQPVTVTMAYAGFTTGREMFAKEETGFELGETFPLAVARAARHALRVGQS